MDLYLKMWTPKKIFKYLTMDKCDNYIWGNDRLLPQSITELKRLLRNKTITHRQYMLQYALFKRNEALKIKLLIGPKRYRWFWNREPYYDQHWERQFYYGPSTCLCTKDQICFECHNLGLPFKSKEGPPYSFPYEWLYNWKQWLITLRNKTKNFSQIFKRKRKPSNYVTLQERENEIRSKWWLNPHLNLISGYFPPGMTRENATELTIKKYLGETSGFSYSDRSIAARLDAKAKKRQEEWWLNPYLNMVSGYYDAGQLRRIEEKKQEEREYLEQKQKQEQRLLERKQQLLERQQRREQRKQDRLNGIKVTTVKFIHLWDRPYKSTFDVKRDKERARVEKLRLIEEKKLYIRQVFNEIKRVRLLVQNKPEYKKYREQQRQIEEARMKEVREEYYEKTGLILA